MLAWSLEGHKVLGTYRGISYTGFVISSYPDPDGIIVHAVALDTPIFIENQSYRIIHLDHNTSEADWETLRVVG